MKFILFLLPAVVIGLPLLISWWIDPYLTLSPVTTSQSFRVIPLQEAFGIAGSGALIALMCFLFVKIHLFRIGNVWLCRLFRGALFVTVHLLTAIVLFYTALFAMDPNIFIIAVVLTLPFWGAYEWIYARASSEKLLFASASLRRDLVIVLAGVAFTGVAGVILIASAKVYRTNPVFMERVNKFQALFTPSARSYQLVNTIEGEVFTQLIDFDIDDKGDFILLERWGRVFQLSSGNRELLLDFQKVVGERPIDELGSYSIKLHKDFGMGGDKFYVWSTSRTLESRFNALWEFTVGDLTPGERWEQRRVILKIPSESSSHNSGSLSYDDNGFLLIGIGEMGGGEISQSPRDILNGTILRIDPDKLGGEWSAPPTNQLIDGIERDYFIPKDNPFLSDAAIADEIWAYGLRNPFRIEWESSLVGLLVSDVGQWTWEELNLVRAGENHGWPVWEGPDLYLPIEGVSSRVEDYTFPLYTYRHTARDRAIAGGFIYQGEKFPELKGKIILGDNSSGNIWSLSANEDSSLELIGVAPNYNQTGMTSLRQTVSGDILIVVMGRWDEPEGSIYRFEIRGGSVSTPPTTRIQTSSSADVYATQCAFCHGVEGRGDGMVARASGIEMPNFRSQEWAQTAEPDYLAEIIEKGGLALERNAIMPAWRGVLSETQIEEMVDYLLSQQR